MWPNKFSPFHWETCWVKERRAERAERIKEEGRGRGREDKGIKGRGIRQEMQR
jgi:hypothetical protein